MPKDSQPWPMRWIVVAILLMIVPYTIITLKYRKEAPAFQPYEDMKNRANVSRLLSAGYQRLRLTAERPASDVNVPGGALVTPAPGGLTPELRSTLVEPPLLPTEIVSITAAPTANILQPYVIQFICELPTDKQHLGGAELYVREEELVLVPTFQRIDGDLLTRSRQTIVLVTLPAGTVKSGTYKITLVGEKSSRTWSLEMR
ncbi:MAG: hypothetical protein V4773_01170 [Verrucomicrobiota bacterium]